MRDYSERRQSRTVTPPPPKRPSVWPSILLIFVLMLSSFAAGLGTGWYLLRPGGRLYKVPKVQAPPVAAKPETPLPPQGEPVAPQTPAQSQSPHGKSTGAPPLTFYDKLQQGNKGLMGTGINQPKEPPQQAPSKPASTPTER